MNSWESQTAHDAFITANGYEYTAAFHVQDGSVSTAYNNLCPLYGFDPGYIPTNFMMDRDGCVRWGQNTISDHTDYRNRVSELLGSNFE